MKLTPIAKEKLRDEHTMMRIALDAKVSLNTVRRWIRLNDPKMTMISVLYSISEHTGIPADEIFEVSQKDTVKS